MFDANGKDDEAIRVQTGEAGLPYLLIAAVQVPQVRVLFDGVGLPYTLDEQLSVADCEQTRVTFMFDEQVKAEEIQRLLDGID